MKNVIWYEKYRQRNIDKLSLDDQCRVKMEEYIKEGQIPHLLFTGPPGSGKTTLAKILIDHCASSKLELNGGSEDRGIDIIRGKVRRFAGSMRRDKNKTNIIFFDEADGLTKDAQKALMNTVEHNYKICRFIFTANDFDSIAKPIYSRCQHYQFEQIPIPKIFRYCKKILKSENIAYKHDVLISIVEKFYPDIRTILNNLQACSIGGKLSIKYLLSTEIDKQKLKSMIMNGKVGKIREEWTGMVSFKWLWRYLIDEFVPGIKDNQAAAASALTVAEYMWRSTFNVDQEINATGCLVDICQNLDLEVIL